VTSADPFQLVGQTLGGKYRIDRMLGEGGYGVVYAGRHLSLDEPIAIKFFKFQGDGGQAQEVFLREARVLFSLTHPGIVRMYDVDRIDTAAGPLPYVVLEFLNGVPLDHEIERRARGQAAPFSPQEILAIFDPIVDALSFAHAKGIAHRDIKPSNVMLTTGQSGALSAKLLDFGTARVGNHVTNVGMTSGLGFTPRYASPEQWDPKHGTTGPASDVFALGLLLSEVCTLHPALQGSTPPEILREVMNPNRASLVSVRRYDLPAEIDQIVLRATRIAPPERFASARELLDALRGALGGRSSVATSQPMLRDPSWGSPVTGPQASVPTPPPAPAWPQAWTHVPNHPPLAVPAQQMPVRPQTSSPYLGLWVVLIVIFSMFAGCLACAGAVLQ
jgi:serine/threonine protein kinase